MRNIALVVVLAACHHPIAPAGAPVTPPVAAQGFDFKVRGDFFDGLRGVGDYEVALAAQTPTFGTLSLHAREQLLYGLTDGYASLGDGARAQVFYRRMTTDAAGSELLARAKARAAGEAVAGPTPCEQCHGAE